MMTIIDKYISNTLSRPASAVAAELGVTESYVRVRRVMLQPDNTLTEMADQRAEIEALLLLIEQRTSGWAVEIACQRIRKLENKHKYV